MFTILFTFTTCYFYHVHSMIDHREAEFSRIKQYELIHINTESLASSKVITFTAFGHEYNIELTTNEHMIPAQIRHSNVDPATHDTEPYFTSSTQSCHYFGRVLSADSTSSSKVSLSICNRRGIRGRVTAFNETLIIYPSAYFLDHDKDEQCNHDLSDEHLVYKVSDFDMTDIGRDGAVQISPDNQFDLENDIKSILQTKQQQTKRRRLAYNNGYSQNELLIVNGPIRTAYYKATYGTNWYQQMFSDYSDVINTVSSEYQAASWGNAVGTIAVRFVELEVIFEFTGKYASLAPDYLYSTCTSSYSQCQIDGQSWLSTFRTWVSQYKDTSTFDNAHLIDNIQFRSGYAGWGNIGVVCRGSVSVSDVYVGWGLSYLPRTVAHEMGHNFGMSHDGQGTSACGANDGLMGYGSGTGFSSCSIGSLVSYFASNGGLTCLGSGARSFTSNYDDSVSTPATPRPTTSSSNNPSPTPRPTTSSGSNDDWTCVNIQGLSNSNYNGYWQYGGMEASYPYYSKDGYFIYYHNTYKMYLMSTDLGSMSVFGYCQSSDITACTGKFSLAINGAWNVQSSSSVSDCGDTSNNIPSTNPGTNLPCTYYDCLAISSMIVGDNGNLNGQWTPTGCHNGQSYYTKTGDSSKYLCYSSSYNLWIITNVLCGPSAFAYSPTATTDVVGTANNWNVVNGGSWSTDQQVFVYNCGGNGGFLDEDTDLECLDNMEYSDNLCIYNNDTLWNNEHRTFQVYTNRCKNDRPIYHYTVSSIIDGDDGFNNENQQNIETIYYLHFHEELLYSDSNETIPQWIISKNEISVNALAICENENLLDCIENQWIVTKTQYGEFDGILQNIFDQTMNVKNQQCSSDLTDDQQHKDSNTVEIIAIVIILVVLLLIIIVVGFVIYRKCYKNKNGESGGRSLEHVRSTSRIDADGMTLEAVPEIEVSLEGEQNEDLKTPINTTYN